MCCSSRVINLNCIDLRPVVHVKLLLYYSLMNVNVSAVLELILVVFCSFQLVSTTVCADPFSSQFFHTVSLYFDCFISPCSLFLPLFDLPFILPSYIT